MNIPNNLFFPLDPDLNGGFYNIFPMASHIGSLVDSSVYNFRSICFPGSLALQEACCYFSKLAFLFCFSNGSHPKPFNSHGSGTKISRSVARINHVSSVKQNLFRFDCKRSTQKVESSMPIVFGKISSFTFRKLCKDGGKYKFPVLSLAAVLIPPLDNVSRNVIAVPLAEGDVLMQGCTGSLLEDELVNRVCSFHNFDCAKNAVEARTGIEFPVILETVLAGGENNSKLTSEVLVGTGSRTMKIIKIKSLKVYAFGFYVHPNDICQKLGPKYASIPTEEVCKHHSFYTDLLREDINMTVRLVVSCNGVKISTVRDSFEKALRARLRKTNPDTDYDCLKTFGSIFAEDIPIRLGTTICFHRTGDGRLVTEIGGNPIGSVHSNDLCRAFFDMYIGDIPVCEQTKEEIGRNVASIIGTCS